MRMIVAVLLAVASAIGAGAWGPPARAQDTRMRIAECMDIELSGSYVLVNNLRFAGDCLRVQASFVTIDLNGFGIFGRGATGVGISSDIETSHITVRNGSINAFEVGILLGDSALVEGVQANNHFTAIEVGNDSTVTGNIIAFSNRAIVVGSSSTVTSNTASFSGTAGIVAGSFSTVRGNTASENTSAEADGIVVGEGSTVSGNTASGNRRDGIVVGQFSTVATLPHATAGTGCASAGRSAGSSLSSRVAP